MTPIEHDDFRALGNGRVELLLLLRYVGVGVQVDQLAARAQLIHLSDETGMIVLLIASRALVGHQEGNGRAGNVGGMRTGKACPHENSRQQRWPA